MLYLKIIFILYEFNVIVIEFFIKIENAYFGRLSVVFRDPRNKNFVWDTTF